MSQPVYLPSVPNYPVTSYPAAPPMVPPGTWSGPAARAISAPASANAVRAPSASAPRPIFRAKGPDDPAPAAAFSSSAARLPLSMPTPEQLGVAPALVRAEADFDWAAAQRRLDRLGVVCLHMDKLDNGNCRFTCILPTRQPGLTHRVEAEAATSQEAASLVLSQAEQWVSSTR